MTTDAHTNAQRLAQQVCDELRAADDLGTRLDALIVTGSVAHGTVDAHSDVDCIIYLHDAPSPAFFERQKQLATKSGGGVYGGTPEEGFGVYRVIDGIKVDLGFNLVPATQTLIEDVIERQNLELDKQLIIRGIRSAIVLHGQPTIDGWIVQTDTYPDALQHAMLDRFLRVRPIWVLRGMGADRNDRLFLTDEILAVQRQILGSLCGLNRVWHPGKLKGSRAIFDDFVHAPTDCLERMTAMLHASSLHDAVDDLEPMVIEMFDLAETHGPDTIDVNARRSYFRLDLSRQPSGPVDVDPRKTD